MVYDVGIIGAGVVGGMTARELTRYRLSVCLLERENDVACGASKANSGIVHGGFDPEPGSCKAQLNAPGVPLLFEAARQLHVPYRKNGSMVCAFSAQEEAVLDELFERGKQNGVPDLELLSGDEARALEPNLSPAVTRVLRAPSAGIVCPYALTIAAVGNAMDNGAALKTNFEVTAIEKADDCFTVTSSDGETVRCRYLVNCAGGYADRIAALAGDDFFRVIPRAGEYLLLDKAEGARVSHTIFQVPTSAGKGVLVSPTADGNLLVGPTATEVETPDAKQTTPDGLRAVMQLAPKSVPSVALRQVITSFTGVRASTAGGDFLLQASEKAPGLVHAAGIDSPGLSCCVSIARRLVELLQGAGLVCADNPDFNGERPDTHAFRKMDDDARDAWIQSHPDYGRIVCRCETVSEGEIRAAIRQNPPARDVDAVKRRTRSGMGRCQGGFCGPYVMQLISEETGIPLAEITKNGKDSRMVVGRL